MESLYNYVLHFNPYKNVWFAIPRSGYTAYFADSNNDKGVLKASKLNALLKLIK
jgi:hypothetical protein